MNFNRVSVIGIINTNGEENKPVWRYRQEAADLLKGRLKLLGVEDVFVDDYNGKVDEDTGEGGTSICVIGILCSREQVRRVVEIARDMCDGLFAEVVPTDLVDTAQPEEPPAFAFGMP
ncbi:MAG: hypothetical protein WCS85_05700 [Candidatus Peribacteraceae bacterium]|jgi:hypothetical protein